MSAPDASVARPAWTLRPVPVLDEAGQRTGMRVLTVEVVFSTLADTVMGGVILTAFALHLGASNALIGTLAAITFWDQLLQASGVLLVERLRMRKLIAVAGSLVSALAPALLAALAFAHASPGARTGLVLAVGLYGAAGAFAGCAWNAWVRDVVPGKVSGRFFGRRSALSTAVGLVAGLAAAWLLDLAPEGSSQRSLVFLGLFGLGLAAELLSAATLSRAPEPAMPPPDQTPRLLPLLRKPFADENFRRLIAFLASWQFAVNLAQPFFTVFFLRQLGFQMTFVMALSLISQFANLLTLRKWGELADRFSNKSVLNISAPAFIGCIAAMILASQFQGKVAAAIYLIGLHLVMGAASAGVALASGNIVMRLSPRGGAEPYMAANALITSAAAGLAPILGGLCADAFTTREFRLVLAWTGPHFQGEMVRLAVRQWDFYFLLSALFGLYALHRLTLVHEKGEVERQEMIREMLASLRDGRRRFMPIAGLKSLSELPANLFGHRPARHEPPA
ncbi:MAG: MFS transporter [Caulobacter sp.]|nr:MFS transporter [Caulobacter sp.]